MNANPPRHLTIITTLPEDASPPEATDEFTPHGRFTDWLFGREVDLATLRSNLVDVQAQVGELLKDAQKSPVGDMRLTQILVGLTITAEGSIGVASIGAEANLTLVYAKAD
jgi:hypothetical protein